MEMHRAISLWQPWATLCCIAHPEDAKKAVKGFETRSWQTSYRGTVLIHAAKRNQKVQREFCMYEPIRSVLRNAGLNGPEDLAYGAIIGHAEITDCQPSERAYAATDDYARSMGDYSPGRYAWELTNPVLFDEPILYRGQQGFFFVPCHVIENAEGARV